MTKIIESLRQSIDLLLSTDLVVIKAELKPFEDFYQLTRKATAQLLLKADDLVTSDPVIPDHKVDFKGHKNAAMSKYGVHKAPTDKEILGKFWGYYCLEKWAYFLLQLPNSYQPGYEPDTLKNYIGFNDPLESVISITTMISDQAEGTAALRVIFAGFPVTELMSMKIESPDPVKFRENYSALIEATIAIYDFQSIFKLGRIKDWKKVMQLNGYKPYSPTLSL